MHIDVFVFSQIDYYCWLACLRVVLTLGLPHIVCLEAYLLYAVKSLQSLHGAGQHCIHWPWFSINLGDTFYQYVGLRCLLQRCVHFPVLLVVPFTKLDGGTFTGLKVKSANCFIFFLTFHFVSLFSAWDHWHDTSDPDYYRIQI